MGGGGFTPEGLRRGEGGSAAAAADRGRDLRRRTPQERADAGVGAEELVVLSREQAARGRRPWVAAPAELQQSCNTPPAELVAEAVVMAAVEVSPDRRGGGAGGGGGGPVGRVLDRGLRHEAKELKVC